MDLDDGGVKRRGRGRGSRARGRGARARGRGRGKKAAVIVSDEEISLDQSFDSLNTPIEDVELIASTNLDINEDAIMASNKENELAIIATNITAGSCHEINALPNDSKTTMTINEEQRMQGSTPVAVVQLLPQTIDMEADISQLEAPTFTTISRGPPEPMLRLKWDHKVNLMGDKVLNPMIHCCDQCDKPILVYGRMIPCKHVFCLKCARTEPIKVCPRCNDKVIRVEQTGLGTVFMCSHGGSRYGHSGCRRTYLSQRDLQAHINHRHVTQIAQVPAEMKVDHGIDTLKSIIGQRKLSESNASSGIQTPSALLAQRPPPLRANSLIGSIAPPGSTVNSTVVTSSSHSHSSLTQANLARINTANAQDCHQGKVALHQTLKKTPITQSHHQQPETVADASYYSSVLNSFGSAANSGSN